MEVVALLLTGLSAYPFVAAATVLLWSVCLRRLLGPSKQPQPLDKRILPSLYWVHCGVITLAVAGLALETRLRPEWVVYLTGFSLGDTFLGVGLRLNGLRMLWLQGMTILLWVSAPFVIRDLTDGSSASQSARTCAAVLLVIGLGLQVILADGLAQPLLAWLAIPVALWGVCPSTRTGDPAATRRSARHLVLTLLAGLPLWLTVAALCTRAGSSEAQVIHFTLTAASPIVSVWVGLLVIVAVLARAATMTVGSWPRLCTTSSPAWCACVEVLLPWLDLLVLLRCVPGLLPVSALHGLAAAQVVLAMVVCLAVGLGIAAIPRDRRPSVPPVNVLALWGVVLLLAGAKSPAAWACAAGYMFGYGVLALAARRSARRSSSRPRADTAVFAVSLATAVGLPVCLSGQMLFRGALEMGRNHGWWSLGPLGLAVGILVWTHLVARRDHGYGSHVVPIVLWVTALALGLLNEPIRQTLATAFAGMGESPRW